MRRTGGEKRAEAEFARTKGTEGGAASGWWERGAATLPGVGRKILSAGHDNFGGGGEVKQR